MAYVISISNVKGGVAKTSTAIALGSSLAKSGHPVLLVDLDAQADLTQGVGLSPNATSYASKNLFIPGFLKDFPLSALIRKTSYENLDIIPSNGEIIWNETRLPGHQGPENILKDAFSASTELAYDFVIFDCPVAISVNTLSAITASNLLIIPTQAEHFSASALSKMMSVVQLVREQANPALKFRILVTLVDLRNKIQRRVFQKLREDFQGSVFDTYVEVDTKIRESQEAGIPIVNYLHGSRGSARYGELAVEILAMIPEFAAGLPGKPATTPKGENPIGAKSTSVNCPFIGLEGDIASATTFPSVQNFCHRARPHAAPKIEYQSTHCLSGAYITCPLLLTSRQMPLPASIRAFSPSIWRKLGF